MQSGWVQLSWQKKLLPEFEIESNQAIESDGISGDRSRRSPFFTQKRGRGTAGDSHAAKEAIKWTRQNPHSTSS